MKHFLFLSALLGVAVGLTGCGGEERLAPGSEAYREAVSAFYTGVVAMEVGEDQRADARLSRVTELAPEEAAAWANLGLLALRRGAFDVAFERLEKARTLAPDNARIHRIIGLGRRLQGDMPAAIAALRQAVALDSTDAKALFALAGVLAETPEGVAEARRLLDRLRGLYPGNLAVLLEQARLAAQAGDAAALGDLVERLAMGAEDWPAEARDRLAALRAARPEDAAAAVAVLRNVLLRTPAYQEALAVVQTPYERVAEPFERLLHLPAPRPTPAPPDDSLAFFAQPLDAPGGAWQTLRVALLDPNGSPAVLLNDGRTVRWLGEDRSVAFPGDGTAPAEGIAAVDYDNDFWIDLALAGPGGFRLLRQDSTAAFVDVTAGTGLPAAVTRGAYTGVWVADLDLEGDLDLILGTEAGVPLVLRNGGDGTFTPWRPFEGVDGLLGFAWADLDADGDPDATLVDGMGQVHVFANVRGGRYLPRIMPPSLGLAHAIDVADLDADAVLDLIVLQVGGALRKLSDVHGGEGWMVTDLVEQTDLPGGTQAPRLSVVDLDNNGAFDLMVATGTEVRVWLGSETYTYGAPVVVPGVRVFGFADQTEDGRLDLIGLDAQGQAVRLVNQGSKPYHWRQIRPQAATARGDRRINSYGIGGEIELRAGLLFQKQPIEEPVVYFGLGDQLVADVARIIWPNGDVQAEFDLLSDEVLSAQQRLKGSCPWLFTFDGERMAFVTDFLWRSPLGLKINAVETAGIMTTEDWVKIPVR
ncbi:MAG: hypothetical protein KatS3mg042_0552 [Rhodothermaceae bacterium]|nr:MAG: hypothetical protein KatS3mg042_0552 [Rhodothermaceae bacterium]